MKSFEYHRAIIVVNQKPYAVWDTDIKDITLKFLDAFDTDYFTYLADLHIQEIKEVQFFPMQKHKLSFVTLH